ncbi:MAG: methyltransferase domain-containing protein [Leptolyngbya sp. SIO4C1]|nr:methyltransferase domain-containing protein [Leptolyngbya sp. SIO4C1]
MTTSSYAFDLLQREQQQQELARLAYKTNILYGVDCYAWQQAGLVPGMQILDLGCGSGRLTCELAKRWHPSSVVGVDISVAMIEHALTYHKKKTPQVQNLSFLVGDAHALPLPAASFDLVYARFLLQHLANPQQALQTVLKVLKPGGTLCIIDVDDSWFALYPEPPSFGSFREQIVAIQQRQGGDPYVGRKLSNYLQAAGFEDTRVAVRVLTTDDYGADRLLGLLSFGAPYHSRYPEFAKLALQAKREMFAQLETAHIWASVGVFVATGRKSDQ